MGFRSRSPSTSSRSRIYSDGSEKARKKRDKRDSRSSRTSDVTNDDPNDERLDIENTCLHCSIGAQYRKDMLRVEIESAVKRLARRLGNRPSGSWPRVDEPSPTSGTAPPMPCESIRRMGTPDIVVSSISSDEESESYVARQTSSERGTAPSSENRWVFLVTDMCFTRL